MIDPSLDPGRPTLSICIATYNRAAYIGETLRALLSQMPAGVELLIVDGASPDATAEVIAPLLHHNDAVRYIRESTNSGVDRDFDKAVGYARGDFCWLMSDDDLLVPGAVMRVLAELEPALDLLVVNSQIRTADLGAELSGRILRMADDRVYDSRSYDAFLTEVGDYLSFIGGVVIKRSRWLERDRDRYFGTLFIHVGVIFQTPLDKIKVLAEPLIVIRYGNAMWTNRGFEIWMFKWPALIWSFSHVSETARRHVVPREPWKYLRRLIYYRAIGAYSYDDYQKFFGIPGRGGAMQRLVALMPAGLANAVTALYWYLVKREARMGIYDLARSRESSRLTRILSRRLGLPEPPTA